MGGARLNEAIPAFKGSATAMRYKARYCANPIPDIQVQPHLPGISRQEGSNRNVIYSFGYKLVHHEVSRTDGTIGIDNQLVIIQIFARFSVHLSVKAERQISSLGNPVPKQRGAYRVVSLRWPFKMRRTVQRRVLRSSKDIVQQHRFPK